jgi:SPX domain protein involved in polyphosphate accumulation
LCQALQILTKDHADNVDYNALKHLIKERTTNIRTNPVAIPGQGPASDAWTQLESELFPILWQQHERVSLFIKSKYGEIKRRLDQVERQLRRLTEQLPAETQQSRPLQQTRKYIKLVQDTESISEDIQSLSQFANTQRLAFKKILKKYRRWTGSANLQARVNKEILNQHNSFLRPDLSPFLERLSKANLTLSSLSTTKRRDRYEATTSKDSVSTTPQQSTVAHLHEVAAKQSSLKFDAALLSVPLGHAGGRAAYWVHPDNLSEAEVLILRHMKHRDPQEQRKPISRMRIHSAMFDNLQRYVRDQGSTTVAQMEDIEGSFASKVALNILWADEGDAVVIVSDLSPVKTNAITRRRTIVVKRADLPGCLGQDASSYGNSGPEADSQLAQKGKTELQEFIAQHRDLKSLAEIHSTRDRFVGINNSKDVGVWAVLDRDITMSPLNVTKVGAGPTDSADGNYTIESLEGRAFPYIVLQFRWEFSRVPEIVRAFDNSHLVERVHGFTPDVEAIYSICSPQGMPKPLWQPLLGRDIRKVPTLKSRRSTRGTTDGSSSPEELLDPTSATSSTGGPSDSMFSTKQVQSSATSLMNSVPNTPGPISPDSTRFAFDQQKPAKQKKQVRLSTPPPAEITTRYWNEYDDGSELGEDSSYAIYVDPEESSNFPGTENISNAFSALYGGLSNGARQILSWIPTPILGPKGREREPLLAGQRGRPYLEDSSDSDRNAKAMDGSLRRSSGVRAGSRVTSDSTIGRRKVRDSRETLVFRTYLAAFLLSYVMLVLSAVLQGTGRPKASLEVATGVIIGVVIALFCGIGGVGLMISRRDSLSWLHRAAVVLAFCVVCAGSGYLLALVGSTM